MFICLLKNNKFYVHCQKLSEKLRYLYYMLKVDVKKEGIEKDFAPCAKAVEGLIKITGSCGTSFPSSLA